MESFDTFVDLFKKWKKGRNNTNLTDILKNGPSYFQSLSTGEIGLALSIFLDNNTGLLRFLADTSDKTMESSIIEGFKLLSFIIQQFYWLLDQYIIAIKKVCQGAMISKCSQNVKTAAADCFESLVKKCPCHDLELNETVQAFVKTFHLCSDTDRAKLFKALSSVAKHYPEAIPTRTSSTMFQRVMNDFEQRHAKSKSGTQPGDLGIYLDFLNNMLDNFSPWETQEKSEFYYTKLYRHIKELSSIDINQTIKFVSRGAIMLLGRHMSLFSDHVFKDAIFWHNTLLKWTKLKGENGVVAFKALSVYYETIGKMLENTNTETGRKILEDLMNFFKSKFTYDNVELTTLQLSIRGFGHMAGACKNYLTDDDVVQMYSLIARKSTVTYANNEESNRCLENIAYYQDALSEILLHMPDVSSDHLTALSTLSSILVKRFPELPVTSHSLVVTSLVKTIRNIRQTSGRLYEEFVQKLVYEGIMWSCSHTLFVDAEREREMKNLDERPTCYKNYLPLWQPLLYRSSVGSLTISVQIFKNMIETCVKFIKKLNLDVKSIDTTCDDENFDIPVAVNDTDFRVFVNLVDLFVDILKKLQPELMESKTNWFVCEIIKKSNQNPLISGFYKLVHAVLKLHNVSSESGEHQLLNETFKLVSKYISDTIERISSFSGELQTCCFNMIFEMPVSMVENMLDRLVSAFKTVFSIGQSNLSLAQSALSTLEKWTKSIRGERMKNFLTEVVPGLESFLQSDESTVDLALEIIPIKKRVIKNIVLTEDEKTLQEFQRRILLFFGSLNSDVTSNFTVERSFGYGALGDDKNLLKYTLLYKDIKPDIYLDSILPRTIELALNSTDRRTRVVACEVLHSIVIVMLGRPMQVRLLNPDRLMPLFKKICPALLRLGSDSDQVIQQLFNPLTIQLTHWYSSRMMLGSSETNHLIETLFDLLTYESNVALSDFCGVCLAEFVRWSIKQSMDVESQSPSTNTENIMRKITNFAIHPSVEKRIGAAVAFNYLYTMLRESDAIIDIFWLELLSCFVKSLDGCNSPQILSSLKHVERVIDKKHELLNRRSSRRRKPAEFKEALLQDAADWLLVQCGSLDWNCRSKSMELLTSISKHLPVGSVPGFFAEYLSRNSLRSLNEIMLKNLCPKIEALTIESMKPLSRTLDCYLWILKENLLSLDLLFTDKNANKDMIFNCVINFTYIVNVKREHESVFEFTKEYQELHVLKCKMILKIFEFAKILLDKTESQVNTHSSTYIPTFFWNDELFLLITSSIFEPEVIGFDLQNSEATEALSSSLQQLMNACMQKLSDKQLLKLKEVIKVKIESKFQDLLDLRKILNNDMSIALKNYLKGLTMLEMLQESGQLYTRPLNDDESVTKVMEIFNLLKKEQYGQVVSVNIELNDKEHLENLLEFLCSKFKPNMVKTLVNIVDSKTELKHDNSMTKFHGEYFMSLFGIPFFQSILKNLSESMDVLLSDSLKDKFAVVLIILEDLLAHVKTNKKCYGELLSNLEAEFVHRFSIIRSRINFVEKRKEKVINLYSLLVQVSDNPSQICNEPNELYSWIMQELLGYLDLEHKIRMLNGFLPCIVGETAHKREELTRCLHKLKTDFYPTNMSEVAKGSPQHSNIIASFQTLSRHLATLKSPTLFDRVINLTIGNVQHLWNDGLTEYLTAYFKGISAIDSKTSLQILYTYFMNTENFNERLAILKNLLLKCIYFCNGSTIEHFFEVNIREIYGIVSQDVIENGTDSKNLIVSKIGCYSLLEIMFAKVPLEKIKSADSMIVRNAIETIETGKELFQALNSNVLNVRKLKSNNAGTKELMRLLQCAAYNCCIAIVSLNSEERFYVLLFAEKRSAGQLVWENIIDTTRKYEFKQDLKEIPREYKKLINIRKQSDIRQAHGYSSIKTYDLVASTLNEDLSCFDLCESNLRAHPVAESTDGEEMMSLSFEFDALNDHECMASICGVITHMVSTSIFNLPNDGESIPMPKWMHCFLSSLNGTTIYNVKFFMVKVILNMQNAFQTYAKSFLTPILSFLNSHFRSYHHMNYVITDILVMLISWRTVAIPTQSTEKQLAQNLLEILMKNADSHQRGIYKYNVEIINMIVEAWKSCLEVPQGILVIPNASEKFIVRMILTFLYNDMQDTIASRHEVLVYLKESLDNPDEEITLHVCNAFGLILNYLEAKDESETKQWIIDQIRTSVIDKSDQNHNKYTKCISEIHKVYPNIVNHCFKDLTSIFSKIDDSNKQKCLELFLSALPNFTEKEITTELGFIRFQDILKNRTFTCRHAALNIVRRLLDILKPSDFLQLALLIVPFSKDVDLTQREIVVDIFMAIYRKYSNSVDDDAAVIKLRDLSRHILLLGLLDANETLQTKLLNFWTEDGNITNKSIDRILEIFNMYNTNLESNYLPIVPLLMLHLVSKDPEYKKKMFEPLSDCKFEDYQVATGWRPKHAGLVAPLFTSSHASRMSQYYSQSNPTFARFSQSMNQSLFLRATLSLQFTKTLSKEQSVFQPSHAGVNEFGNQIVNVEKIPQPSKNKRSKRFLQNTTDVSDHIRQKQISMNLKRGETIKENDDRQRNSVKIYRKYRIGDFPDTEITHSSLIEPLQELVKNDQVIARDLTVAIFRSMLKEIKSLNREEEFLQKLSTSLKLILENTQGSKPLVATILEIILNSYDIHVSPNVIANVSKSCGLLSLGALLLEEKMISGHTSDNSEPSPKKSKQDSQAYSGDENNWLQLANIYKSLNDFDIVQSIFGCEKFGKELQEASFAQAASEWSKAKVAYGNAYQITDGLAKDYCQESLFTCLAHLSNWKQIDQHIETELKGNFDSLWQKPMTENWMASWALQAQIQAMVQNECSERFLKAMNDWVNTKDKLTQLKGLYGEEMAIFYIDQNPEFSSNCLRNGLEKIRQEWKHLNPVYYEQKVNKYLKLRGLSDIKTYLEGMKDKNQLIPNVRCTITLWNNSVPVDQDNLLLWDKHIAYRLYLFGLMKQQFQSETSSETNEMLDMLNDAVVRQCLNITTTAYGRCNLHFMKKYLGYSEQYLNDDDSNQKNEWQLGFSKYKYLCYFNSKTQEKRVKSCVTSWDLSHNIIESEYLNEKLRIDVRRHISSLAIELQKLIIKSEPIGIILLDDQTILERLPTGHDEDSILKQLSNHCLIKLKECCELGDPANKASCYLEISKYCHYMSGQSETGLNLSNEFIHSTLSAMSYGSLEATQYFPCLLQLDYLNCPELGPTFESTSQNVETWMFIKWQAQLLSHIGTPIHSLIAPILLRLAERYPNCFVYAFRMTKEMNKSLLAHPFVGKLNQILSENKDLDLFLDAMKYVVQPELYLKYHLSELEAHASQDPIAAVNSLLATVYPSAENREKTLARGDLYKCIARYEAKIKELAQQEGRDLVLRIKQMINELDVSLKERIKSIFNRTLREYSPWLCKFSGGSIEVPGQYAGDKKPEPQYHAKIMKVNPYVTILPSLRKPINIRMLGNNGKSYNFLVKFGEDLRTDERIQQLFMIMNKILQGDAACRQRQLGIDTYLVIPLTGSLGLIQWVDNTGSLNDMINSVLTGHKQSERVKIIDEYVSWLSSSGSRETIEAFHSKAVLRYGRQEVTTKFNNLKIRIGWNTLREAFKKLSSSPESFFALRHNFITSYATICIAQWILGIGDRNLSNTLISYTSGKALGIDFGYSFDAAVDLSPPELMPFRLTPQILGLLQPFDENGLLKVTMINVLRAIKHGKDPLLACMDIFIKEPSLDWLAKKRRPGDRKEEGLDVKWYPKKKIDIVVDKLNGVKPSKLTLTQIKDRYGNTEYFSKYIDVINGSEDGLQSRVRSARLDENLSIEEQVECLLDQATDPNILGRTWVGWEPWI